MSGKSMDQVTTVGIDIGKNTFHFIGLDSKGAIVLRQKLSRSQVRERLAQLERRIEAQHVEVVAILVTAGDGQQPRPDHVGVGMDRARRVTPVAQRRADRRGEARWSVVPAAYRVFSRPASNFEA